MQRTTHHLLVSLLIVILLPLGRQPTWAEETRWPPNPPWPTSAQEENLLVNGHMEDGFYKRYPNHYVANDWHRWWIHETVLPEFADTQQTDPNRPHYEGKRAQAYFLWGASYTAGIFQVVEGLTPCTPYRLATWARNHSLENVLPHARVGLDPQGVELTSDGAVKNGLPEHTVWSEEQTALFTWEELSVQAEPAGSDLTAILYASPDEPDGRHYYYYDTLWDAATLVPVSFADGRLPAPASWSDSGFVFNTVTTRETGTITVEWDTLSPASSQVWYDLFTPTTPITYTGPSSYTSYFPLFLTSRDTSYDFATTLEVTPTRHHSAVILDIPDDREVRFVVLSRRPLDSSCVTEAHGPLKIAAGLPPAHRHP